MGLYQQERGEVAFDKLKIIIFKRLFFSSCFRLFEVEKPSWRYYRLCYDELTVMRSFAPGDGVTVPSLPYLETCKTVG